jgi:hypothetical protein
VEKTSDWGVVCKALSLIKEDVDVYNPDDIAYVTCVITLTPSLLTSSL